MALQLLLPQGATHGREFVENHNGVRLNGTCGQTALAACYKVVVGSHDTTPDQLRAQMVVMYDDMRRKNLCALNGGATLAALLTEAKAQNMTTVASATHGYVNGVEPMRFDWLSVLRKHAGIHPILMQVAKGRYLVDNETKIADEPKLDYHAIAILGKKWDDANSSVGGYVVCDGDQGMADSRFAIYAWDKIRDAIPISMATFNVNTPATSPVPPAASPSKFWTIPDSNFTALKGAISTISTQLAAATQVINAANAQ